MSRHMAEIECELKDETDKAYLVIINGDQEHWVPKSLSVWTSTSADGVAGELEIAQWFAEKEGMV